jgi:hypothetical protein
MLNRIIDFNVNDTVQIQLTDIGRTELERQKSELRIQFPQYAEQIAMPKEDADGWSSFPLWQLIRDLGHLCEMGRPEPFKTNIRFELPNVPLKDLAEELEQIMESNGYALNLDTPAERSIKNEDRWREVAQVSRLVDNDAEETLEPVYLTEIPALLGDRYRAVSPEGALVLRPNSFAISDEIRRMLPLAKRFGVVVVRLEIIRIWVYEGTE